MSGDLRVFNRQRGRAVDTRLLRRIIRGLLEELMGLDEFDLVLHLVNARAMARFNQIYLRHEGPTDVITLDYRAGDPAEQTGLTGEIIVCVDVAVQQARQFRVTWPTELVRYIIHGILHLEGHDDRRPALRRRMKHEEAHLLKNLSGRFRLSKLARKSKIAP